MGASGADRVARNVQCINVSGAATSHRDAMRVGQWKKSFTGVVIGESFPRIFVPEVWPFTPEEWNYAA